MIFEKLKPDDIHKDIAKDVETKSLTLQTLK